MTGFRDRRELDWGRVKKKVSCTPGRGKEKRCRMKGARSKGRPGKTFKKRHRQTYLSQKKKTTIRKKQSLAYKKGGMLKPG